MHIDSWRVAVHTTNPYLLRGIRSLYRAAEYTPEYKYTIVDTPHYDDTSYRYVIIVPLGITAHKLLPDKDYVQCNY